MARAAIGGDVQGDLHVSLRLVHHKRAPSMML